jgi:siroheme synthase
MTVRGQRCLADADVVLYDHLVRRARCACAPGCGEDRRRRRGIAAAGTGRDLHLLAEKAREGKPSRG